MSTNSNIALSIWNAAFLTIKKTTHKWTISIWPLVQNMSQCIVHRWKTWLLQHFNFTVARSLPFLDQIYFIIFHIFFGSSFCTIGSYYPMLFLIFFGLKSLVLKIWYCSLDWGYQTRSSLGHTVCGIQYAV